MRSQPRKSLKPSPTQPQSYLYHDVYHDDKPDVIKTLNLQLALSITQPWGLLKLRTQNIIIICDLM